jgi:phosphohistidine phosphatase
MELYLIRHAHAVDKEENPERPLSERGRKQVRALAKFLATSGALHPAEFWHSSLVRSRQTAELLAERMNLHAPLVEVAGLEPCDEPALIGRRLKGLTKPLAIVGHEPHLSALATLLIGGTSDAPMFVVRKSAVIALEGAGPHWQVRWHLSPELLA